MTTPGYSRAETSGAGGREPSNIVSVDVVNRTATALLRSRYTVNVNTSYAVGDSIITPAVGEQWYVERFDMEWRLAGRIPFNDPTLNIEPEEGQVSVGSASGPLELNGTQVRANGPFRLGLTLFSTNASTGKLQYSLDEGGTWVPVGGAGGGGGGGGDIDSTDDLPEGGTNKYYTAARVATDAPVKKVAGKTGNVTLVKGDVSLGNVDNTSDALKPISNATQAALNLKADLVGGLVPDFQLRPRSVLHYANMAALPLVGAVDTVYITVNTGLLYYFDTSDGTYKLTSGVNVGLSNTDSLPEGTTNKYYTDARVQTKVNSMYGAVANTITQGNDARLSDQRVPTDGSVTVAKLATDVQAAIAASPYDVNYTQCLGQRAVGYGQNTLGVKFQHAVILTQVLYRCITADASGSSTFELRKNGTTLTGSSVTIAAAGQVTGASATGTWSFAEGDILTVAITAVGTTPGNGLVADIKGNA